MIWPKHRDSSSEARSSRTVRRPRHRKLRIEPLELRRLLSAVPAMIGPGNLPTSGVLQVTSALAGPLYNPAVSAPPSASVSIGSSASSPVASTVASSYLFYKGSAWDVTSSNLPGFANDSFADDNAIAPDKAGFVPGGNGVSTIANVSSYSQASTAS